MKSTLYMPRSMQISTFSKIRRELLFYIGRFIDVITLPMASLPRVIMFITICI